jgi:hypothetical protein
LKLERYDFITYILNAQLFNNRAFPSSDIKICNKIVTVATRSVNYWFLRNMYFHCTFTFFILSFFWNRIIGALSLWHLAELPPITIWNTRQLKCSRTVWNLNVVLKSCFQFWVWVSYYYNILIHISYPFLLSSNSWNEQKLFWKLFLLSSKFITRFQI